VTPTHTSTAVSTPTPTPMAAPITTASTHAPMPSTRARQRKIMQFVRTPKGSVLIALALLGGIAAAGAGWRETLPAALGITLFAALMDVALARIVRHAWVFPSGALVTGLIIALVLDPHERWYVSAVAVAVAIGSKYAVRARRGHIFNPAVLGLLVVSLLFASEQSWWGSLPDLAAPVLLTLVIAGYLIGDRVNKLPMVLVFAGTYCAVFTAVALVGDPVRVAEMFRPPFVNAMLFFAFFMLSDPPTSPSRYRDQVIYGLIVGAVSIAVYLIIGGLTYLLVGLLVGNIYEAWRRTTAGRANERRRQANWGK